MTTITVLFSAIFQQQHPLSHQTIFRLDCSTVSAAHYTWFKQPFASSVILTSWYVSRLSPLIISSKYAISTMPFWLVYNSWVTLSISYIYEFVFIHIYIYFFRSDPFLIWNFCNVCWFGKFSQRFVSKCVMTNLSGLSSVKIKDLTYQQSSL